MDLSSCLTLRQQHGSRLRYQIHSDKPFHWRALSDALKSLLPEESWYFRVNPLAASVVIHPIQRPGHGSPSTVQARQIALQALVAALGAVGVQPPAPPIIVVRLRQPVFTCLQSLLRLLANLGSAFFTFCLDLLFVPLLLASLLGLALPLAPGLPLVMLAVVLLETSLWLRRPFVNLHA